MDKFGSHSRNWVSLWRMFQDLDMNNNRITSLRAPKDSADAATKQWVNQQLKDGMADVNAMETEIEQIRATLNQLQKDINGLTKTMQTKADKLKCFATNGGTVSGDLDMQDFLIGNLPEVILSFRREVTVLESKIDAYHP